MAEKSKSMLPLEERMKYFPWIATVNKRFSKCFPLDYNEETLRFFHREIEKELEAISIRSTKKNEALFSTLLCFYNHFCWKTKWKEPSPRMKSSCARILSSICKIGLVLSKGNVQSKWINQVLSAVSVFPGDNDFLYDALLQIYKLYKKYYSAYAAVLRHILKDPQPKTENPSTFFKLILLFRRLKFLLQNPYEKARVDALAAAVAIPRNLMSWLADNELQDVGKAMKKNKMIIMKRKFANRLLLRIREAVLHNTYRETSPTLKDNEDTLFSIDCNPETVNNELLSKSLNVEEDISVATETDVGITKSKRKGVVEPNESHKGNATKKRKTKDLDSKRNEKRTSIEQSRKEVVHEREISEIPNEYIDSDLASNLDSNTSSNSKKKQKKNSKAKFNQVPRKEVNEKSVDISLKEERKSLISTNMDEIENDLMLIQSCSSATQSIKKEKKRNTINTTERYNPKVITNEASINEKDLPHDQSVKKGKKKKIAINIVEDIEKSSHFGENESLNGQSAEKDQKNRKSIIVVQKPQDIEKSKLAVNEKNVSATKKGKKRKSINLLQESILNDRGSQSESETDVSLYVQSIETGRNRRTTINIAQDTSRKDIKKDLLNVSSSRKGKKKRQTINIVEEINPKNIKYQSKFNEKISLCTSPVTKQNDCSSTPPRKTSKTNKKRKSLHFTSADFIVTPSVNVDSVAKEDFNENLTKRNSTSTKNEWIVTVNKSDSETIPRTSKTPPEKHNFKVSEMNETISETVAIEAEVGAISERNYAKNIVTPVALTSTTSESETANTGDEVADGSISESESLETAEKAKATDETGVIAKVVKFGKETESIVSTNETKADNTEDDDESISETESVDSTEEAKSTDEAETIRTKMVEFVEETESIISTNEMEAANTEDEEADESISETESVDTSEEAESADETGAIMPITGTVKFVHEAETIASTNETKDNTEDKEAEKSLSKTESVDPTEEAKSTDETETIRTKMVEFVKETKPIISTNEMDAANTDDEESGESISETESVDTSKEAKSSDETGVIMTISETVKFVDEAETTVSTNEAEAFESIDKPSESNSLKEAGIVETTESEPESVEMSESVENGFKVNETAHVASSYNTELSKPVADTEKVETVEKEKTIETVTNETNKSNNVGPSDETKAFKSIPETIDEKNVEDSQFLDTVTEPVKLIEETKEINSSNQTEAFESIPETEDKTVKDSETDESKGTVDIMKEIEDINSFNKTADFESIPATEDTTVNKIQTRETVGENIGVKLVNIVKEAETIDITYERKDFEPIPETEEETMKDVEIVVDANTVNTIEETDNIGTFNTLQDFEPIPETEKETMEDVEIVLDANAVNTIEETEDIGSFNKSQDFEPIPETEEETMEDVEIVVDANAENTIEETEDIGSFIKSQDFEPIPETNEIIEEAKDIDSAHKIDSFKSVPETEEETMKSEDIVVDSEAIEIIKETEDIYYCFKNPDDFDPIPETEEEFVDDVEIVECSQAIEIVEETEDIDSTKTVEEFAPIPETKEEENGKNVETVKGSVAIEIIEETKDIDSINKIEEFEHVSVREESENNVKTAEGSEAIEIVKETDDIVFTNKMEEFELIPQTKKETVEKINVIETTKEEQSVDIVKETENIDSINRTRHLWPIAETKERTDEYAEAQEAVVNKETTYSTLEETTAVSTDETKTVEGMEVVKDGNATISIDETETVESVSKPEAVDIQEPDVTLSDSIEALEFLKDTNTDELNETDGTYIKTKTVKTVQETGEVKPVKKAEVPENLESTDKTEAEDSDEILEIIDSTDRTETEDTDEFLEILESSPDDKTEETDEQLENFESTNKAKTENNVDKSGDMEHKDETENITELKNVIKKVTSKYNCENVSNSTQCSPEISESELDTSITKYNSLVKEIFCDAGSDDSVRESLSPHKIENIIKHSVKPVSSQSVMPPKSNAEILENNPSLTKNCENSSENIADESTEIEEEAPINNTQYYCKLLLKEVTEDNFIEDSETVDESKNIVDLKLSKNIPNQSSSGTTFDSRAQFEEHSSIKMDISSSKVVVETISNDERIASKDAETVESIAEGLYKKILKAKKERLSLMDSVPEKTAAAILTENTVSYVIEKVIKNVEDVNNTSNVEDFKKQVGFKPEKSQLPKLGNLSNLKPFGFPDEKSECLSFVDFSKEKVSNSTEIESSESSPQAKRKDFYPYRNLLTIEVPDDKSESNFSDVVVDDKLEETICVPNEEDSSEDETDTDEEVSQSPVCNTNQNETVFEEPKINEESLSSVLKSQNSPKLDSEELISLVRTIKIPVVNLGLKCDNVRFEREFSQHDNDVVSSYDENEIPSTETEKQIRVEDIVESQTSLSISQESKNKESKPENVVSENENVITTRKLRNRNPSVSVVTNMSTSKEKYQTPEKCSHTRSRRKPANPETSTELNSEADSTNLRRSTRRLRNEFKDLCLDSPKRCNPVEDDVIEKKVDSDANANSSKSKKTTTRSTAAKENNSAVSKTESDCSDPSVEVEDEETNLPKETLKNSSTRKRATRSTANKITKYFSIQTKALTPVNEQESEDPVEDSAESSTENLPVKKRFTRSNAVASDKSRSEPFDAKEDVKDFNLGDVKSKNTVPKRSTRTTTRGASRTKLSQNTLAKEESDVDDMDTQSNVSEESHKENVANEDESASKEVESGPKEYNLRRSTRNLIRPSRLKLYQDHF